MKVLIEYAAGPSPRLKTASAAGWLRPLVSTNSRRRSLFVLTGFMYPLCQSYTASPNVSHRVSLFTSTYRCEQSIPGLLRPTGWRGPGSARLQRKLSCSSATNYSSQLSMTTCSQHMQLHRLGQDIDLPRALRLASLAGAAAIARVRLVLSTPSGTGHPAPTRSTRLQLPAAIAQRQHMRIQILIQIIQPRPAPGAACAGSPQRQDLVARPCAVPAAAPDHRSAPRYQAS